MQVEQPKNLNVNLFPHQLHSIYNMEKIEKEQKIVKNFSEHIDINIGILADDVGSGKTLTMIGLICRDKMTWDTSKLHDVKNINTQSLGKIRNVKTYNLNEIIVSYKVSNSIITMDQ